MASLLALVLRPMLRCCRSCGEDQGPLRSWFVLTEHQRLDWDERGVLNGNVELSDKITAYVTYGDWVGRMGLLLTLLAVLYFSAYRIRRKNHLV